MSHFFRLFLLLLSGVAITASAQDMPPPPSDSNDEAPKEFPDPPPLPDDVINSRPQAPPPDLPDPSELIEQLKQLDQLLRMDPDRLKKLRQTIEFIEKMSSAERDAMRIRLSQITQMTPELKSEIAQMASWIDKENREALSQFWLSLDAEDRQKLRTRFNNLSDQKKATLLEGKLKAFIKKRDQAFQEMQQKLDKKRNELLKDAPGSP